jgi:predicted transcriptional regulator of viral defense system
MAVGPEKAIVSHESALALLELSDNIPDKVHLLVPRRSRGLRPPPGVAIHTFSDAEKVATVRRDGMVVTAPARTLVDAADDLQPEQAAMAARQALSRGLLTRTKLEHEAERRGKSRLLQRLLPEQ